MKKSILTLAVAAAAIFGSCSSDDDRQVDIALELLKLLKVLI